MSNETNPSRVRTVTSFLFGNWVTRAYLLTVLAAAVFAVWAGVGSEGPSFAGIYMIGLTMPVSMMGIPLIAAGFFPAWLNTVVVLAGVVAGALFNAALISGAVRLVTRRARPGRADMA